MGCGKPARVSVTARMAPNDSGQRLGPAMYTRSVDEAQKRLHELRQVEWQDLGLGGLALGFAVAATQVRESLALPLFVGGVTLLVLGLRALWQRWDLVDRLAGERDAYGISEVLEYASRETSMDRRRTFAAMIRNRLDEQAADSEDKVREAAEELEALVCELENPDLELDPACAVACSRMLSNLAESPFLNPRLGSNDLRSCVCQIRSGFRLGARHDSLVGVRSPR